jgi:hypothetical protein
MVSAWCLKKWIFQPSSNLVMTSKIHNRLRILYIAGWGRSGSTILGNILGQAPGFQFVGEAQAIWQRGVIENQQCGCGERFKTCGIWAEIFSDFQGEEAVIDPHDLARITYQQTRTSSLPRLLISIIVRRKSVKLKKYLEILEKLYRTIQHTTGCKVIVDSSKSPIYGTVLGFIPGIEIYFVHLVRDVRAVAYSYGTLKHGKEHARASHLSVHHPIFTAVMWSIWNTIAELLGKLRIVNYHRLRYEDFTSDPQKILDELLSFIGEPVGLVPVLPGGIVHVDPEHSISGNPSRFQVGKVQVKPDTRWVRLLALHSKIIVTFFSWPLMLRYRYV